MKITNFIIASLLLVLSPFSAFAANVTIDTNSSPYSADGRSQGVGVISDVIERQAAMFAMIGIHNTVVKPANPIKNGDVITFKWRDGSSEKANAVDLRSSVGIAPIPGTQSQPSGGGIGYTTDGSGNSLGGSSVIGFRPIYVTITYTFGGVTYTETVIGGYEWVYTNMPGIGPNDRQV